MCECSHKDPDGAEWWWVGLSYLLNDMLNTYQTFITMLSSCSRVLVRTVVTEQPGSASLSSMWRVVCQPAQSMKAKWGATNLPSGWNHKLGSKGAQLILNCLLKCGHYSAVATSPSERTGTSRVALALKCRPSKAIREGLNPACLAAESAYTLTWESECISVF